MTKIVVIEELRNERPTVTFRPGQVIEVPDYIAQRLIFEGKGQKYVSAMPPTPRMVETAKRKPQTQKSKK